VKESKEATALYILETTGNNSTNHDDKLTLRLYQNDYWTGAMKDGGKVIAKGIGLAETWRESPYTEYEYKDGEKILGGYLRPTLNNEREYLTPKEYLELENREKESWRPYYKKCIPLGEGVKLAFVKSTIELRIYNLFDKLTESRYGMALEHMSDLVDKGILKYKPRTGEKTEKKMYNAIRNRILKAKQMFDYEHNTLLNGAIGKPIYDYLRANPSNKMVLDENTIYLQGHKKASKPAKAVKMYDSLARDGLESGKIYKIETTLHTPYFTRYEITVDSLTTQPDIMKLIKSEIESSLTGVMNMLSREVLTMTAMAYGVESRDMKEMPRQIARAMLKNTLTQDVEDLKIRTAELERWRARVEKETGIK